MCGRGSAYGEDGAASASCIDVSSFGAKGDGKSDDTKALQSALDAAGEKSGIFLNKPNPGREEDTFRIERCMPSSTPLAV
jgi:polygalacturonase